MIVEHPHSYTIVEIKRDEITERSVGQLARYVGCFRDLLVWYGMKLNLRVSACAIAPSIRPSALDALRGVGDVHGWFIPFDLHSMRLAPSPYADNVENRSDFAWSMFNDILTHPDCAASDSAKESATRILSSLETLS